MNPANLTSLQHKTFEILMRETSPEKTITGKNLAIRLGLNRKGIEGANLRAIIHALRVHGFPICANGRGYFYARTREQLSRFIVTMQGRVMSQEEALKGLKASFGKVGTPLMGQIIKEDGTTSPLAKFKVKKYARTPNGVAQVELELGTDGQPIVPPGMQLV